VLDIQRTDNNKKIKKDKFQIRILVRKECVQEDFEDTKRVVRIRKSKDKQQNDQKDKQHNGQKDKQHNGQKDKQHNGQKDKQHNGKKKRQRDEHYTENQRLRNTNPTKNQGRTQVLRKSRGFLLLLWNQDDKSVTFLCKCQDLILIDTCHSLLLFVFNDLRREMAGRDVSMDEIVKNSC
jgi:hypothetical protein